MILISGRDDGWPQASPVTGGGRWRGAPRRLDLPGTCQDAQRPSTSRS